MRQVLLRRLRYREQIHQARARRVELQIAYRARARFHRRHLAETPRQRHGEQTHARIKVRRRLAFRAVDRVAALLMLPYVAWVAFATVLNVAIWRLNPAV